MVSCTRQVSFCPISDLVVAARLAQLGELQQDGVYSYDVSVIARLARHVEDRGEGGPEAISNGSGVTGLTLDDIYGVRVVWLAEIHVGLDVTTWRSRFVPSRSDLVVDCLATDEKSAIIPDEGEMLHKCKESWLEVPGSGGVDAN